MIANAGRSMECNFEASNEKLRFCVELELQMQPATANILLIAL
jgi:hypothetical protein